MPKETPRPQPASERREPTQPESKAPLRRKTDEEVIDPEELAGGLGPKGKARAKAEQARKKR